jgi:tetratricopeptide (TPR) repeat protein
VKTDKLVVLAGMMMAIVALALAPVLDRDEAGFTLSRAVPSDVFLYAAERRNPDADFLRGYWGEIAEALAASGIGEDAIDLVGTMLGAAQAGEISRIRQKAESLITAVDWEDLSGKEMVFAERMIAPEQIGQGVIMMPEMVWMFRGSEAGAKRNFKGLVAILEAIADEVNTAKGAEVLSIEKGTRSGARVASVDLLGSIPGAPPLPVSIALRDDIVLIAMRAGLFHDVLQLLDGKSETQSLAKSARFRAAFQDLPPAEDSMFLFDMQAMLGVMRPFVEQVVDQAATPGDVYVNHGMSGEVTILNARALAAYRQRDYEEAVALIRRAHEAGPDCSIVLYNLACFNALVGNSAEALDWLDKAVEGGFYAPRKIADDADLVSLHDSPRYKKALARAAALANAETVRDAVLNSSNEGEAYRLRMQAWQVAKEKGHEAGLPLIEQANAAAPHDSAVIYDLACFHAQLGHENLAADLLRKAVDAGFYCPEHIANDSDLKPLHADRRYEEALKTASMMAARNASDVTQSNAKLGLRTLQRIADAVGILDHVAVVETTDGYSVRKETAVTLVPDAKERPFYRVLAPDREMTDFARFIPKEAVNFSVSSGIDAEALYGFLEDTLAEAGPRGEEVLAKIDEVQAAIGLDVHDDILSWVGGTSVSVSLEDGGSVWLMQVKDEDIAREKVASAVDFLSNRMSQLELQGPAAAMLPMLTLRSSPVEHEQLQGFHSLQLMVMPTPAVWGVTDGHLVMASSADAAAACLATAKGEHPGIRDNARVMSEAVVPDGHFASVIYADKRHMGENMSKGVRMATMMSAMMVAAIPDKELRPLVAKVGGMVNKLPPVLSKIDFYKSTASATTFDGQKWHTRAVTHYFSPEERDANRAE